jgi:hypothetical protein
MTKRFSRLRRLFKRKKKPVDKYEIVRRGDSEEVHFEFH